ncbi:MAG: type II toxin-antitoxin system Phd/YefM family antitoxin [Ottowia sp.]|nr:type II toxin-antitoxin system Phd/YefM family antitoxin [Ottowia sp.]
MMRTTALAKFLQQPDSLATAAEVEPILLVRESAENLVLLSETDWHALQETIYLLQSTENMERLVASLDQALMATAPETHIL